MSLWYLLFSNICWLLSWQILKVPWSVALIFPPKPLSQPRLPSHLIIQNNFLLTLSNHPCTSGIKLIQAKCTFPGGSYITPQVWDVMALCTQPRCSWGSSFFSPDHCQHIDFKCVWTSPTDSWGSRPVNRQSSTFWPVKVWTAEQTGFCELRHETHPGTPSLLLPSAETNLFSWCFFFCPLCFPVEISWPCTQTAPLLRPSEWKQRTQLGLGATVLLSVQQMLRKCPWKGLHWKESGVYVMTVSWFFTFGLLLHSKSLKCFPDHQNSS